MRTQWLNPAAMVMTLMLVPGVIGVRILQADGVAEPPANEVKKLDPTRVERGAYLVRTMMCNDCHTPWTMGPKGPEPDMTRALTGHPQDFIMPPPPKLPEGSPWVALFGVTNTAFAGPWGVSFAANLTPIPRPASANTPRKCSWRRSGPAATRAGDARCCHRCRGRSSAH